MASDLDEADNASGTTSSSEAKSEKTENPNNTPTLSRENSKPEPAKPGIEFSPDNVGVLGFSVFSLLALELEVVPLVLLASFRSEANEVLLKIQIVPVEVSTNSDLFYLQLPRTLHWPLTSTRLTTQFFIFRSTRKQSYA